MEHVRLTAEEMASIMSVILKFQNIILVRSTPCHIYSYVALKKNARTAALAERSDHGTYISTEIQRSDCEVIVFIKFAVDANGDYLL